MWNLKLYKHVIYARNKTHWKALMGIDGLDRTKQTFINFINIFKDLEPDEKEKLAQDLKSSPDVDQEMVTFLLQVIHKE